VQLQGRPEEHHGLALIMTGSARESQPHKIIVLPGRNAGQPVKPVLDALEICGGNMVVEMPDRISPPAAPVEI